MPDWSLLTHTNAGSTDTDAVTSSAIDTTGAVVLVVICGDLDGTSVVTDSKGNTWAATTAHVSTADSGSSISGGDKGGGVRLHYCIDPASVGSGHTFTATGTGKYPAIAVLTFAGPSGSILSVQQGNQTTAATSNTISTGSITPSRAPALIVTGYTDRLAVGGTGVFDFPNGATELLQAGPFGGLTHFTAAGAYCVQSSVASQGARWACNATYSVGMAAVIVAFTQSGGGPVDYEDPCTITEPRIFAQVNTGSETLKFATHPLRDTAALGGFAEPRLLDVGPITRVASDPVTGAWSAQTASMQWADTDRANRARSETRTSLRNCSAEIYLTSNARRLAGGLPRVLFAGKIYADTADENLVLSAQLNDLIGVSYSLFAEEKQIPQRTINVNYFPNCPVANIGKGEPIVGGRRAPLQTTNGEGVSEGIYVGQVRINGAHGTPTGTTLSDVVTALNASGATSSLYTDYGSRIGFADAVTLQSYYDSHGTVPTDYDALAQIIGYGDLDALLAETAHTGGDLFEAVVVASHAIKSILNGSNGNPSIWIDDTQLVAADKGTSWWAPQISGDTTWASDIGSDLFTDIQGSDGTTRRYTLILFSVGSSYATSLIAGGRLHLDCTGLEDVGDGTGTALTDYFDLYLHVLVNFILQDYQSGAWLSVPQFTYSDGSTLIDRVDSTSFTDAAAVVALNLTGGRLGSFTIGDRTSVRDVIATFNLCGGCRLGEDDFGRLRVKVLDTRRTHFFTNVAGDVNTTLRDKIDILPGFWIEPKPEWQVNLLRYQYGLNGYTGNYERGADGSAAPTLVEDTTSQTRDGVLKKTIAFPYVSDDGTATDVATYYLDLFKNLPHVAHYARRGLCGLEDDVLDGRPITHYNGYGASGWTDHAVWILSKTFNPKTMHCEFTALDVESRIADAEATALDALTLDPVALEDLFSDDTGVALYADS